MKKLASYLDIDYIISDRDRFF